MTRLTYEVYWALPSRLTGRLISRSITKCSLTDVCSPFYRESLRAHLQVIGMLRFMSDINQPSLPIAFYSVLVSVTVFMALSTVFHSINSPDNSPFSDSVLPVLALM